jgi:hypothetical protein
MTPWQQLDQIGARLYGPSWVPAMSRDTGYSLRMFAAWKSGETPFPAHHRIFAALIEVCERRAAEIRQVRQDLDAHISEHGSRGRRRTLENAKAQL